VSTAPSSNPRLRLNSARSRETWPSAILAKLAELESDPLGFTTTALVSQPDRRRLRVGDYRVNYTIDNGELVVWVVHVGHRSTVYDT
jgi:mRNA interferase RelE/StbE